jgi:hypothetical protein
MTSSIVFAACLLHHELHLHMNPMLPAGLLTLTKCEHSSHVCVIPYIIVLLIELRLARKFSRKPENRARRQNRALTDSALSQATPSEICSYVIYKLPTKCTSMFMTYFNYCTYN